MNKQVDFYLAMNFYTTTNKDFGKTTRQMPHAFVR